MRAISIAPPRPFSVRCAVTLFACGLGVVSSLSPVLAATPLPVVIPAPGNVLRYRVTRTAQGNTGTRSSVSTLTLRRKSATSLTLAGLYDRPSVITILDVAADGSLKIPDAASAPKDDSSLNDTVKGINRLTAIFAGMSSVPHDGWSAKLRLPEVRGATAPVVVPIAVENVSAADFEMHGVGQLAVQAQAAPAAASNNVAGPPGAFGRRGGFGGPAAFAGGPLPLAATGGTVGITPAREAFTIAVSVDGRIRHRAVGRVAIVETRSVTVDALPFVNVSGWTIEALK